MIGVTVEGAAPPRTNFTPDPVILTGNLREDLVSAFDRVAQRGAKLPVQERGITKTEKVKEKIHQLFSGLSLHGIDCVELIRALCTVSIVPVHEVALSTLDFLYSVAELKSRLPASQLKYLRQQAKYVLYLLWAQGKILLPITFSVYKSLSRAELYELTTELALFCLTYPEVGAKGSTAIRMVNHVPRWLVCTGWRMPEDVSLPDALAINRFLLDCGHGKVGFSVPSCSPSVGLFLNECLKRFPDRVKYTVEDLRLFELSFGMRLDSEVELSEVASSIAAKREEAALHKRLSDSDRYAANKILSLSTGIGTDLSLNRDDAAYLIYELKLKRVEWFCDLSRLSFLTKCMSDKSVALWSGLFRHYIQYRIGVKGLEATNPVENSLRVLADYLSICIPVSYHYAAYDGRIPSCPREFTRFPFIDDRGEGEGNTPTFLKYVGQRFSNESAYSHIGHARLFFEYIEANYQDEASSQIAGPGFRNPIAQAFDMPRVKGSKARGTNKKPFGKSVVPHLLQWLYAVERFGIHIQDSDAEVQSRPTTIRTADFGLIPHYEHMGTRHEIHEFPARLVRPVRGYRRPSLTLLRLITGCLEIGLRMQGLQWLCRKKFDGRNKAGEDRHFFLLNVNTDKTNDGFIIPILPRVRELLLREKSDQEAYGIEDVEIFYENREHTRFDKLLPLFRNVETSAPYGDKAYATAWNDIMEAFHAYYRSIGDQPFVRLVRPKVTVVELASDGGEFCPLKVEPLYTPHSCRSTFITRRSPFIVLDDLAKLVGQASGIVASHYDYPEHDELAVKLLYADEAMARESDPPARIKSGPAFIKAKERNSALRVSFEKDRAETISRFGMIALQPGLDAESEGAGALELLRASPVSQIVFRETHICPVGEHCPAEVIVETGGDRRCGLCPLACKCIDHLPAIAAKQRQLLERVNAARVSYARLSRMDDQAGELGEIYDAAEADFQEYLGWRLAEEILENIRKNSPPVSDQIHVAQPEIVRQHLTRVVKRSTDQEFVLRRIVESNEYPTFATDTLRLQALKMTKHLMAGIIDAGDLLRADHSDEDVIVGFARYVSIVMKAKGLSLEQLAEAIARPLPNRRTSQFLLTADT